MDRTYSRPSVGDSRDRASAARCTTRARASTAEEELPTRGPPRCCSPSGLYRNWKLPTSTGLVTAELERVSGHHRLAASWATSDEAVLKDMAAKNVGEWAT
eukprot:CAMPEP_0117697398 /NCGR_PEP_ID=MMETSP0804-20121206/29206_1 /TAXON_ID=1074897 /ORGANISM="Tetraselmis astigmatica, Strain CCMP880" /LENGTH=100 /DNA_ID=CAMNT_0005511643 /DNA_START=406 /DNA_END=708 /DNA_ORIENTATION=-